MFNSRPRLGFLANCAAGWSVGATLSGVLTMAWTALPVQGQENAGRVRGDRQAATRYVQADGEDEFLDLDQLVGGPAGSSAAEPAPASTSPATPGSSPQVSTPPSGSAAQPAAPGQAAEVEDVVLPSISNEERLAKMDLSGTREILERYGDGSVKSRVRIRDLGDGKTVRHGPYVEFYQGAGKFCEGLFVDGKRDGAWKFYYRSGSLAKQGEYSLDKAVGTWFILRENGTLDRVEQYRDGRQNGRWVNYGPDGKTVLQVRQFQNGQPHGRWEAWYDANRKKYEMDFSNGLRNGKIVLWYPNGNKWMEGEFAEGERHGRWSWWTQNGRLQKQGAFVHGEPAAGQGATSG